MDSPKYARILDTRLEAISDNQVCYALKEGSAVTSFVPLQSSSHNINNTTFNLNNISDFTGRDSRMVLNLGVVATLRVSNSTASAINFSGSQNLGLKQYPLNRCIGSIQHQINQASYTLNTNDILDSIARINLLPSDCNFYENSMPDYIDSYENAVGTLLTPLASYASSPAGNGVYKPRTLRLNVETSANGTTYTSSQSIPANAVNYYVRVSCELYEPLVSPFNNISKEDARCLYAITGELINIQWVSQLWENMFAYYTPTGLTITSSAVSLGTQATLSCIYLTPKEDTIAQIPRQSIYQYNDYSIFTNAVNGGQPVAAGSTIYNVASQVVNFTNLPQKILVYARLSNGSRTTSTPDKYLKIQSLQVSFDNGLPQFAGASPDQLYDISVRNNLEMPRSAFKQERLNYLSEVEAELYGCGSLMIIDPCLDLGIRPSDTTGSGGRYIFQLQNSIFVNATETEFPSVTLYVVGINSAVLERVGSQYRNYLLTTPPDVINQVKSLAPVSYKTYMRSAYANSFLMGGGVGDWFKKAYNFGTRAFNFAKDKVKEGEEFYKGVKGAVEAGKQLIGKGYGPNTGDRGTRLFGANPRPSKQIAFYQ